MLCAIADSFSEGNGGRNLLASIEEQKPPSNGQKGQEELTSNWEQERENQHRKHSRLPHGPRRLDNRQGEDSQDQQQQVLKVVGSPTMTLK